jgi:hypothetical protein
MIHRCPAAMLVPIDGDGIKALVSTQELDRLDTA